MERLLAGLGYERAPDDPPLRFPAKRLRASWFRPREPALRATLPRVFVSELEVRQAQAFVRATSG
jgi:hypothetical protein